MNIQEVKQIRIADYLQSLGYTPVKQQGSSFWYKSPLREETDASFKVNTELNKWYDFGLGKGGNIIALAAELYHTEDVTCLLKRIEERTPYIRPASFSFGKQQSDNRTYRVLRVGELSSPALIAYLQERGIDIELAKRECKELRFENADKPYFAIGFPNMARGYEVRNRYFKGCVAPKDITHIRQQGEPRYTCYVFEGMMDYLSFLSLRLWKFPSCPSLEAQDYVVLNSTSNVDKAVDALYGYERISCLLDNDDAGRKATLAIENALGYRVRDASHLYSEYKDLNDYLCGVKSKQSVHQVQPVKQTVPPRKRGAALGIYCLLYTSPSPRDRG